MAVDGVYGSRVIVDYLQEAQTWYSPRVFVCRCPFYFYFCSFLSFLFHQSLFDVHPSICMRPDSQKQVANNFNCLESSFIFFLFWFFGDLICLFRASCTIAVSFYTVSCCTESYLYLAVRSFLPDGVFDLVTMVWIFDISLCENSIN